MRLADFILQNLEPILADWDSFARTIWPASPSSPSSSPGELRDHAKEILRTTVADMNSHQSAHQQSSKSMGRGDENAASARVDDVSGVHAVGRVRSGFDLLAVVAEYRAVRASVIRLWRESEPDPDRHDLDDLTRFNESIDQSLTKAIASYTTHIERSRGMFLAILGHDLRNPLNAISLSAQALALDEGLDKESTEMVEQIASSTSAMGQMISDLLDFTGTSIGAAMPIMPAAMDLESLCRQVVAEQRAAHTSRVLRFESRGDLKGRWDAARLRQLLSNLLGNAVQHGADPIELIAEGVADGVRITVRNQGTPIKPELLPTIFQPLVRGSADQPGGQRLGSMGLGLYIAREVARAHHGNIDVKSDAETGTTFTIQLPRG